MKLKKIKFSFGFTLIELLMVVSIIGMLSSIILANISDARKKAYDSAAVSAMQQVRNALGVYIIDKGFYPTTLTTLVTEKYIPSIKPGIKYDPLISSANFSACTTKCQFYHLAVALNYPAKVLTNDSATTTPAIKGESIDCGPSSAATSDLCYDITP